VQGRGLSKGLRQQRGDFQWKSGQGVGEVVFRDIASRRPSFSGEEGGLSKNARKTGGRKTREKENVLFFLHGARPTLTEEEQKTNHLPRRCIRVFYKHPKKQMIHGLPIKKINLSQAFSICWGSHKSSSELYPGLQ